MELRRAEEVLELGYIISSYSRPQERRRRGQTKLNTMNGKIAKEISRAPLLGMIMASFAVVMSSELKQQVGEILWVLDATCFVSYFDNPPTSPWFPINLDRRPLRKLSSGPGATPPVLPCPWRFRSKLMEAPVNPVTTLAAALNSSPRSPLVPVAVCTTPPAAAPAS